MSSTPQQRVHDATLRLLGLLESGDSLSAEAIELRAELAEATAAADHLEDAFYQADELLKDVRREYGPEHAAVTRARETVAVVEKLAMAKLERQQPQDPAPTDG